MAESSFEKTEAPTPRRLREAKESGNVARSTDLTAACVLMAAVLLLNFFGFKILTSMKVVMQTMLDTSSLSNPTQTNDLMALSALAGRVVFEAVIPVCLGISAVAFLASVGQVGFILTAKPITPELSKISPLQGLKRLFDARAGMRLVMSLGKIGVIALIAILVIQKNMPRILRLAELEALPMFAGSCELVYSLSLTLAAVLLILAILDFSFQKWQHTKDLRMTKQEIKEELKQMDGDPLMKQRRTRVARQLALQRIGQAVPNADVVVTNPTHFSIALRYDSKTMTAPKVVAKGADFLAMRIRQLAIANGIPIVERKDVARAMYKSVQVGQEVPPQFYSAVAEILAYVYRLSGGRRAAS